MFLAAELCACEGEVDAALKMLQLSLLTAANEGTVDLNKVANEPLDEKLLLRHPRLREEDLTSVTAVLEWIESGADGEAPSTPTSRSSRSASAAPGSSARTAATPNSRMSRAGADLGAESWASCGARLSNQTRLLLVQMLLTTGRVEPWPATLVALAVTGSELLLRGVVRLLERHGTLPGEQIEVGKPVLAYLPSKTSSSGLWERGLLQELVQGVEDKRDGVTTRYRVRFRNGERPEQEVKHVLLTSDARGVGAILRKAAESRDGTRLVRELVKSKASVHHADEHGNTALHAAAIAERPETCRLLLKYGAAAFSFNAMGIRPYDITMSASDKRVRQAIKPSVSEIELEACIDEAKRREEAGVTPSLVHIACAFIDQPQQLYHEIMEMHLSAAQVNAPGAGGVTALMVASACDLVSCVTALLNAKADPEMQTRLGCTALTMAAERGQLRALKALLPETMPTDAVKRLIELAETKDNTTALMRACQNAEFAVVEELVARGAALDTKRKDTQRTALTLAVRSGALDCIELLLEHKADVTVRDREQMTPLASAAYFGHAAVIERLAGLGSRSLEQCNVHGESPLALATMFGHEAAVRTLLRLGARVDVVDQMGNTPLMHACLRGHELLLPPLLSVDGPHATPVEAKNAEGHTALMLCCMAGHVQSAEMLMQIHADLLARGPGGVTALMLASRLDSDRAATLIRSFVQACGPAAVARAGSTPAASQLQRMETMDQGMQQQSVALLLNAVDDQQRTALHHAAETGHAAAVQALLQAGADRLLKDDQARTALMTAYAVEGSGATVFEFRRAHSSLLERGGPPLIAYVGKHTMAVGANELLGVGALAVDMGTSELKLMALCRFAKDELHELVSLKYEEFGPVDAGGLVRQAFDAAGEITPTFASLVERLCGGLASLKDPSWQRVTFTRCFIGATAWFRSLAETDVALSRRFMDALVRQLSAKLAELGMGFDAEWGVVEGTDEARYETAAVEYAMRRDEREIPVAVIAGGSGSVQLTGLDHFQSFQMPVKKGMETVKEATSRAAGLGAWGAPGTAKSSAHRPPPST